MEIEAKELGEGVRGIEILLGNVLSRGERLISIEILVNLMRIR